MEFGPPKSEAGKRAVALPGAAVAALRPHVLEFVGADQDALVFVGDKRGVLRSGNFRRAVNGPRRSGRRACRPTSTSTICATSATTWRRRPAPVPGS